MSNTEPDRDLRDRDEQPPKRPLSGGDMPDRLDDEDERIFREVWDEIRRREEQAKREGGTSR